MMQAKVEISRLEGGGGIKPPLQVRGWRAERGESQGKCFPGWRVEGGGWRAEGGVGRKET